MSDLKDTADEDLQSIYQQLQELEQTFNRLHQQPDPTNKENGLSTQTDLTEADQDLDHILQMDVPNLLKHIEQTNLALNVFEHRTDALLNKIDKLFDEIVDGQTEMDQIPTNI